MNEIQVVEIPKITLNWSPWIPWTKIELAARSLEGIYIPNKKSGVYEVRYINDEKRLTIGKASNLRLRVRQGLVKGKASHSSGDKIRLSEDITRIVVRWAETEYPSAVEEELHKQHIKKFGSFPLYVMHT